MWFRISFVLLLFIIFSGCVEKRTRPPVTRETAVSRELLAIVERDQQLRYNDTLDYAIIAESDRSNRERIYELLARGEITESKNLFHAAIILQYADPSSCPECFLLAYHLSLEAVNRGFDDARSLAATSLDRYLVFTGHPQKYGTQIGTDSVGVSYLYEYDNLTTDSMRRLWDIPPLDSLKAHIEALNRDVDPQ